MWSLAVLAFACQCMGAMQWRSWPGSKGIDVKYGLQSGSACDRGFLGIAPQFFSWDNWVRKHKRCSWFTCKGSHRAACLQQLRLKGGCLLFARTLHLLFGPSRKFSGFAAGCVVEAHYIPVIAFVELHLFLKNGKMITMKYWEIREVLMNNVIKLYIKYQKLDYLFCRIIMFAVWQESDFTQMQDSQDTEGWTKRGSFFCSVQNLNTGKQETRN